MTQVATKIKFYQPDIIRIIGYKPNECLWLLGDNAFMVANEQGIPLWQEEVPYQLVDAVLDGEQDVLLALAENGSCFLRDKGGKRLANLFHGYATAIALSPDASIIAVGTMHGLIQLENQKRQVLQTQYLEHPIDHLCFAAWDSMLLFATSNHGRVSCFHCMEGMRWSVDIGLPIRRPVTMKTSPRVLLPALSRGIFALDEAGRGVGGYGIRGRVLEVAVSEADNLILVNDNEQRLILMQDDAKPIWAYSLKQPCLSSYLDASGKSLGFVSKQGEVNLLEIGPKLEIASKKSSAPKVESTTTELHELWRIPLPAGLADGIDLELRADGDRMAYMDTNGRVALFDEQGKSISTHLGNNTYESMLLSHWEGTLYCLAKGSIDAYHTDDGKLVFKQHQKGEVRVSENGSHFVVYSNRQLKIFEKHGISLKQWDFQSTIVRAEITRDGEFVFVLLDDGKLICLTQRGEVAWRKQLRLKGRHKIFLVPFLGGILVAVNRSGVTAFGSDGDQSWYFKHGLGIRDVKVVGDCVLLHSQNKRECLLLDKQGQVLGSWQRQAPPSLIDFSRSQKFVEIAWRHHDLVGYKLGFDSSKGEPTYRYRALQPIEMVTSAFPQNRICLLDSQSIYMLCFEKEEESCTITDFLEF